ncbi:MAG: aspartate aminotransferase family protein [Bacteroidia bacterium]
MTQRESFLRHVAQTSQSPLMIEVERAEGCFLYAPDGKRYLDLISGIGVSNVGHCAPEVVAAVQAQAARYMHTMVYGEFVLTPQVELATLLSEQLGSGLDSVYFVNSGSEAVEGALKLAKKFTGRQGIVAMNRSYHGSTHGALSVTGAEGLKAGYGPFLPGVRFCDFGSPEAVEAINAETAAIILEPIQGEAGVRVGEEAWLRAVRQRCNETGALLIFDEIQSGFGRTGTLFAWERFGIKPDILLMAKGMGGGMPIGAFVSRREVMQVLTHDPVLGHITTFGGHPVSCAASLAALRKILNERLMDRVPALEAIIREELSGPGVLGLRGRGLLFAAEVGSFDRVLRVIARCLEGGVLTDWFLHCDTAIRIAPPLVISEDDLRMGLQVLAKAIQAEA